MSIASYVEWAARSAGVAEPFVVQVGNGIFPMNRFVRLGQINGWTRRRGAVTTPVTGAATYSKDHPVSMIDVPDGGAWLAQAEFRAASASNVGMRGTAMLVDLLCTVTPFVGNLTSEQTENLPTPALARHSTGEGVAVMVEEYTAVGSTQTTYTLRYTNQDGVSGRTSQPMLIGGSAVVQTVVALADGDTGVRSVEGITLAATTGGAGVLGISLIKPLTLLPQEAQLVGERQPWRNYLSAASAPWVPDGACLDLVCLMTNNATGQHIFVGGLTYAID